MCVIIWEENDIVLYFVPQDVCVYYSQIVDRFILLYSFILYLSYSIYYASNTIRKYQWNDQ